MEQIQKREGGPRQVRSPQQEPGREAGVAKGGETRMGFHGI